MPRKPPAKKPRKPPAQKREKPLGATARAERNAALIRDRAMRLTWPEIAAKYGITERGAQKIYADWRDAALEVYVDEDIIGLAFDYKMTYEAVESSFASLAEKADNDNARVGALRALLKATNERLAFDQALGKLPRNLGKLRVELDIRHVSQVVVGVMKKHGFSEEVMREVQASLRGQEPSNN